ncbi:hypothetical protein ES703_26851 [subsurface metagenome]
MTVECYVCNILTGAFLRSLMRFLIDEYVFAGRMLDYG